MKLQNSNDLHLFYKDQLGLTIEYVIENVAVMPKGDLVYEANNFLERNYFADAELTRAARYTLDKISYVTKKPHLVFDDEETEP